MAASIQTPETRAPAKALPSPPPKTPSSGAPYNPFRARAQNQVAPSPQPPSPTHSDLIFLPESEPPKNPNISPVLICDLTIDEEEHARAVEELKMLRAKYQQKTAPPEPTNQNNQGNPFPKNLPNSQETQINNPSALPPPIPPPPTNSRPPDLPPPPFTSDNPVPARPQTNPNLTIYRASLEAGPTPDSLARVSPRKTSSAFFTTKHKGYDQVETTPLWEETLQSITVDQFNTSYPLPSLQLDFEKFPGRRHKIVNEILQTEQSYIRSLQLLISLFDPVITAFFREDDYPSLREALVSVFKTLKDILGVNSHLQDNLFNRLTTWSENQQVGDMIFKMTPFLKIYQIYAMSYKEASQVLNETEAKSKSWKELMERLSAHPLAKTQSLSGFLVQPVQRIPRYVLLLTDLIKDTPETHPDYQPLNDALNEMKQVAVSINESINAAENRAMCLKIQNLFGNTFEIVSPHRKYITEGTVLKQCRKEIKERRFFVFSDILVYGFEAPGIDRLIGSQVLKPQAIHDVPDSETHINAIQIVSSTKSFNIYCQDKADKQKWLTVLTDTLIAEQNRTQTLKNNGNIATEAAPVWVPDGQIQECPLCQAEFTFLFRRHHCRMCGTVVCKHCSENKVFMPHVNKKNKERVCDTCFKRPRRTMSLQPT